MGGAPPLIISEENDMKNPKDMIRFLGGIITAKRSPHATQLQPSKTKFRIKDIHEDIMLRKSMHTSPASAIWRECSIVDVIFTAKK